MTKEKKHYASWRSAYRDKSTCGLGLEHRTYSGIVSTIDCGNCMRTADFIKAKKNLKMDRNKRLCKIAIAIGTAGLLTAWLIAR